MSKILKAANIKRDKTAEEAPTSVTLSGATGIPGATHFAAMNNAPFGTLPNRVGRETQLGSGLGALAGGVGGGLLGAGAGAIAHKLNVSPAFIDKLSDAAKAGGALGLSAGATGGGAYGAKKGYEKATDEWF